MKSVWCFFVSLIFLFALACCDSFSDDSHGADSVPAETGTAADDATANTSGTDTVSEAANATNGMGGGIAYLALSVCDENGKPLSAVKASSARTALPQLGASDFSSFTLDGSRDGGFDWVRLWTSSDSATNALSELETASVAVTEGHWQFRLTAKKGGAKYTGFHARTEIVAGQENALSFTLSLSALGADEANATGGVRVSVAYPADDVANVTAELRTLLGATVDGFSEEEIIPSGSGATKTATYEKSGIAAGTYAVVFRFYATDGDSGNAMLLGSWTEYAGIASGVTSVSADMEKNRIESLDQTYTISYHLNGGSLVSGQTAQGTYARHDSATLPVASQVTKTGYTFAGWRDNASLSGEAVTQVPADSAGDKSFWLKWDANTYTVRYHKNTAAADTTVTEETFTYDKTQSLSTLSSLGWTRSDAIFVGWALAASGTTLASAQNGTSLTDGAGGALNLTSEANGTVDLYAVWKYTVSFDGNKGASHTTAVTGSTASQTVTGYGTNLSVNANGFAHSGYTFSGWNSKADGTGTAYAAGTAYTFSANTTLYAQWTLNTYTITYNLNSGTNASANPATYTAETATITFANPTRTGYTFSGWYTESSFATKKTQIAKGSAGNVTLYAKWTAKTYTVTLNANGGSGGSTSVTATYDSAMPSITAPTRTGYTFAGYYDTSAATGGTQYYTKDSASARNYTTDGTKTLYAQWTANTYTVTISTGWAKGVTTTGTLTATYDAALPALTTTNPPSNHPAALGSFKRTGYTLNGFYDAATGGTKYYNADGTSAKTWDKTANTTLYAQWTALGVVLTSGSTGGMGLVDAIYVFSQDLSFTTSTAGDSGITIGAASVSFYIEEGVTVTAKGAAGANAGNGYDNSNATEDGTNGGYGGTGAGGGGAGIHVPSGRTLNLYGYGTLNATGGKGGNAGNGGANQRTACILKSNPGKTGAGGGGGGGAGGGGAGIGTPGGNGGSGGNGGARIYVPDVNGDVAGAAGKSGGNGSASAACGTINKQSTLTVNATAGSGGSSGSGGSVYLDEYNCQSSWNYSYKANDGGSGWSNNYSAGCGAAGGGGGAGYNGASIGTGGAGAGGGGGGGSGAFDKKSSSGRNYRGGYGGNGGSGSTAGGTGSQDDTSGTYTTRGAAGAGGSAGGGAGSSASVGAL